MKVRIFEVTAHYYIQAKNIEEARRLALRTESAVIDQCDVDEAQNIRDRQDVEKQLCQLASH